MRSYLCFGTNAFTSSSVFFSSENGHLLNGNVASGLSDTINLSPGFKTSETYNNTLVIFMFSTVCDLKHTRKNTST